MRVGHPLWIYAALESIMRIRDRGSVMGISPHAEDAVLLMLPSYIFYFAIS